MEGAGQPYTTFSNGVKFPTIGLGTLDIVGEDCKNLVVDAILNKGYRNIDTAPIYQNQGDIGDALQEVFATGKVKRDEVFITSKLWRDDREDIEGAVRRSLSQLKVDYIDLYLIHQMVPKLVWEDGKDFIKNTPTHKVWAELERLVDAGLIKSIGVSNANVTVILDLMSYARIKPVVNQIELHPYLVQNDLVAFFEKLGIKLMAYSPLSAPNWPYRDERLKNINLLADPVITSIATKHGKTPAQVILNWHLKRGHLMIPRT